MGSATDKYEKELKYLNKLAKQDISVPMIDAAPMLMDKFGLDRGTAMHIVKVWTVQSIDKRRQAL